jgi:predicted helicase
VIEAEWQAVLNTHTEHNFHDAFKKMAGALGIVHTLEVSYFEGDGSQ